MQNNNLYLSVIIPCYNEERNLKKDVLLKVENHFIRQKYASEIIIVDDGSTDGSLGLIKKIIKQKKNFKLVSNHHLGKAQAIITGMKKSLGKYLLFTDLDQATPIYEVDKMLKFIPKFDIVVGSRKEERKGAPLLRLMMARGFMMLREIILGLGDISDTQCGFKLFKREAVLDLVDKLHIYTNGDNLSKNIKGSHVSAGFDVEMLYIAKKRGYKIKEVDVDWKYVDTRRVSPLSDSIEGLLDLLKIKLNEWKGVYN